MMMFVVAVAVSDIAVLVLTLRTVLASFVVATAESAVGRLDLETTVNNFQEREVVNLVEEA